MSLKATLIIAALLFCSNASAVLDLVVKEKLKVYKKKSKKSRVVTTLVRGDRVVISPVTYSGFRKVLVTYDGKRQAGFVPAKTIRISVIQDRNQIKGSPMIERHSFGAFGAFTYTSEGEGDLELNGFPDAQIGATSGFQSYFGVQYTLPVAHQWTVTTSIANRQFHTEGNAEVNPGGGTDVVEKTESALSFGAFAKHYSGRSSIFWKGAGLEVALVNNVNIREEGGSTLPYNGEEDTYVLANGGIGFDIEAYKSLFVVPEVRAGAALNASPLIFYLEGLVGVHYVY